MLEPEVDEGAEAAGVQGAEAEDEGQDADHEGDDMLAAVVFRKVDLVLNLQTQLR